jgi:type I restriction enzyme S subunit
MSKVQRSHPDWRHGVLGDAVVRVLGGGTPSRSNPTYWGGGIPWASVKDFQDGNLRLDDTEESIMPSGLSGSASNLIPAGTPIVCTRMAVGRVASSNQAVAINQDLKALFLDGEQLDSRFALRLLDHLRPKMDALAIGSTVKGIDINSMLGLPVRYPSVPEQVRIAEVLETVDEAIRQTEQGIAKLEKTRTAMVHDLLRFGAGERGEIRVLKKGEFQESVVGPIPGSWVVAPFDHYASPSRPVIKTGPFGSTLKGDAWVDDGVPVITIGALGEGEVDPSQLLFVSKQKALSLSAYVVREGDLLFSRVADVGRSIVVSDAESGWIMSSNLMWISLDQAQIDPHFAWLSLTMSTSVRSQIRRSLNAGGREVANGAILRSLRIAWPSLNEQRRIVALERTVRQQIRAEKVELGKLQTLKTGISCDLLAGSVRSMR